MPTEDTRDTREILADIRSLTSILAVGVGPATDLNPHAPNGPSDGDSFYLVSYLQDDKGHNFTLLFHLIVLNKPVPPAPLSLLAMSVLDETAPAPYYFSKEITDFGQKKTGVSKAGLDIRMFNDGRVSPFGSLFGTIDNLRIEGHAADAAGKPALDISLTLNALGPSFSYMGTGIIPFPGGLNYEYALPRMGTSGTLAVNGSSCNVTGTSWLDREWGHFGPAKWTWMSIELHNGIQIGLWDQQPYDSSSSHVGGPAFATILHPNGSLTLTTVTIKEDPTSLRPSADGKRTYANRWSVSIPGRAELIVDTLVPGQEINDTLVLGQGINAPSLIPRLEARCSAQGSYEGSLVTGLHTFVEVGTIAPPPP